DHAATADPGPWVALLPGLDPTAMGWKQRAWYLDDETNRRVTDRNGNIGPTVWSDGRIVGGWVQRPDGTIAHDVEPSLLDDDHTELLRTEIERLQHLVGETRFTPRFPSPNQRALLS
ncbi:MAG: winged helix DNA-binding domain-containing protein, partial [Ilumatobacter sp.]|nr:winged helix DNA-binding domain-containing protein [Ilumatobacter sp.]